MRSIETHFLSYKPRFGEWCVRAGLMGIGNVSYW